MDSKHRRSLLMLKFSYIAAFSLIVAIVLATLIINQIALYRETISRQAAALESRQSIRSQRLGRDAVLFLVLGSHAATIKEMENDLLGIQQDRTTFLALYSSYYPQLASLDGGHGRAVAVYYLVLHTAQHLIFLDTHMHYKSDDERLGKQGEGPDITTLFYKEQEQLLNIQAAQAIINEDTDSYIASVRNQDIASSILSAAIILFEAVFVLFPSVRYFSGQMSKPLEPGPVQD